MLRRKKTIAISVIFFCVTFSIVPYILNRQFFPFLNPIMFKKIYKNPEIEFLEYRDDSEPNANHLGLHYRHPFFRPKTGLTFQATLLYLLSDRKNKMLGSDLLHQALNEKLMISNQLIRSGFYADFPHYSDFKEITRLNVFKMKITLDDHGQPVPSKSSEEFIFSIGSNEKSFE
jgi:hypothetical protein